MKVFIVVIEERHFGIDAFAFADLDEANIHAWNLAEDYVHPEGEIEEYGDGRLSSLMFSEEGGRVTVFEKELDKP